MKSVLTFLLVLAAIFAGAALLGIRESQRKTAALLQNFKKNFGQMPAKKMSPERYAHIPAYFKRHMPLDATDDITWNDLDMDAVFARMDSTLSSAGEEVLYAILKSPVRKERGIPLKRIRFFEEPGNEEIRLRMQLSLHSFGHCGKYSLYDYLDLLDEVKTESNFRHLPAFCLPAVSIALLFVSVPAGVLCLIASLVFNMITYYRRKGEIEGYLVTFTCILRMLKCADEIASLSCSEIAQTQERLRKLCSHFSRFRRGSFVLLSGSAISGGNFLDIVFDYVRIFFHVDLIKFNTMLREVKEHQDEIDELITILGELDAAIALSSFEKSLPFTCEPNFLKDGPVFFEAGDLYHPLVLDPVPNSLRTDKCVLLTGSNASGKSTFLKAAALCALFAQTIGFCPARTYKANVFRIRSSMALRDSIVSQESYFMVEIRSIKRIEDLSKDGGLPVFCLIDEVLRGTNTIERIAASSEILQELARRGVLVFAATHDIELASLLDAAYGNFHFSEEMTGEDVVFSYRLYPGRAVSRNAIRLLSTVGFDKELTKRAQKRAEDFEATGIWR